MDQLPEIKNPLQHNGTNRFERLADEMDFGFVQIEERHEKDFLRYAEKLASGILFYDQNDQPYGTWQSFFNADVPSNRPHKALFIAFLRLLEALNQHANGLTKRHLDFYYREVLQFVDREAQPSQVHLFFKCAKTLKERFIEKGAQFYAGDANNGEKILYKLVDEIVVNRSELVNYLTVYRHHDDFKNRIYSKDYSEAVLGVPAENKDGIHTFGEHQLVYEKDKNDEDQLVLRDDPTMDQPEIGFAISSPILKMEEGLRIINLDFDLSTPIGVNVNSDLFEFSITGEEGWQNLRVKSTNSARNSFSLALELLNTDPAITNYDAEIHLGQYNTKNPVLRILLKNSKEYGYFESKSIQIIDLSLFVDVKGVRSLIVQNEQSTLDPSKPFRPFGALPKVGSHFYIGHSDLFKNQLAALSLEVNWKDLPQKQFQDHYEHYSEAINNNSFKVETAYLQNKEWQSPTQENLFATDIHSPKKLSINTNGYVRKSEGLNANTWNYKSTYGFARLTLTDPNLDNFAAFGHSVYPKEVMRINIYNANRANDEIEKELNTPYTPLVESLTLDYTTATANFSENETDQFYHVTAYGQKALELGNELNEQTLLPQFPYEGELYIGIKQLELPQTVSLLFQFIEGTADASQSQIKSRVDWFYLAGNDWIKIDQLKISKDTTRNLLNTGIIRFDLPKNMDAGHQIMPNGLFWIKAGIPIKSVGIDRLQSIHIQAAEVIEVDPDLHSEVIPPESISKLMGRANGISEVVQPFASFGGTNLDEQSIFYARITERLRHKDRGIMIWDYERLVLDSFPELYKVKCLNHTNYQTELVAGHVMLAVIPNLRKRGIHAPFQPKLSIHKRMDVYEFLRERISPFIYLRVENPIYEPIQLSFNVGFHQGKDEGFYGKKLHQQIQEFLSPWAFENELTKTSDLVFGGELHKSTILKFIEDLAYVDFVNDFNMYHIFRDPSISEKFSKKDGNGELFLNAANHYSKEIAEGPCSRILMRFKSNSGDDRTQFIELKIRFLKGLVELDAGETIDEKFRRQLYNALKSRAAKGKVITKTLLRIIIKNIYYVDRLISIDFHVNLPDDYVMADVDVAVAKTSRSVMVTAEQHRIGVYSAGDYNCEGNVVIGIGFMIVEADFIVPQIKEESYEYKAR
jgi:hypothetical protein